MLLYAIQKTTSFEKLLAQRFSNSKYMVQVCGRVVYSWITRGILTSCSSKVPRSRLIMRLKQKMLTQMMK